MYKNLTKAGFQVAQKTIECNPRSTCSPRTLMEQPHSDHTQGGHNDQVGSTEVCHPVPAGAWNLTLCSHTTTHSLDIGRDAGLRNFRESPPLLTLHTSASVQLPQPKLTTARAFAHRPCRVGSSREVLTMWYLLWHRNTLHSWLWLQFGFFIMGDANMLKVSLKGSLIIFC